jgi:uncharacterized protein
MLVAADKREAYGEVRYVALGFLRHMVVVLVFVEHSDDTIRIISLRKASRHERERFAESLKDELGAA